MILFAWCRLTPPGFIGGAEITEGLWAASLASLGYEVWFVGSAENPRNPAVNSRDWLEQMLHHEDVRWNATGSAIEYLWRGVHCICVPQVEILSITKSLLGKGVSLLWTSQERCHEIAALSENIPLVSYMHSVSEVGQLSLGIGAAYLLAPSQFVQQTVFARSGIASLLVRPIIEEPSRRSTSIDGRDSVLFVNPIPEKGLDAALILADAIPERHFIFVEGWRKFDSMGKNVPCNVSILPRQPSLGTLFAGARLLIAPSTIPDAAPRVVSEAGRRGIPVLASRSGGIPELVANPIENCIVTGSWERWISRARQLLEDESCWQEASLAQVLHSEKLVADGWPMISATGILKVAR